MKKILPLVSAQALYQTAAVLVAALSGLVGFNLAEDKSLATLPVALISVGTAAVLIPASVFMKKYGRKRGFMIGVGLGFVAGALTSAGIYYLNFWLFVVGNMFIGAYGGFAQYYRFAAAESVAEKDRSKAISWVVSGGVVAAIAGPWLARLTKGIGHLPFFYSFVSVSALSVIALWVISAVKEPGQQEAIGQLSDQERPLRVIAKQPVFVAALVSSAVGFAVMVMVMTATPIAMKLCGHDADDSSIVIQWHVLGMFVPSFFTGNLVQKFGAVRIISLGILIFLTHVAFALTGTDFFHFVSGLIFLGVGWNFMFIGGTSLLTRAYTAADRAKTQSFHDFSVYAVTTLSSFLAGAVLNVWGWEVVNMVAVPFLVVALVTIQWFGRVAKS